MHADSLSLCHSLLGQNGAIADVISNACTFVWRTFWLRMISGSMITSDKCTHYAIHTVWIKGRGLSSTEWENTLSSLWPDRKLWKVVLLGEGGNLSKFSSFLSESEEQTEEESMGWTGLSLEWSVHCMSVSAEKETTELFYASHTPHFKGTLKSISLVKTTLFSFPLSLSEYIHRP